MGTVTITPTFTDYTNGQPWANAQAGAVTAITNSIAVLSSGLATPSGVGNIAFKLDFGYAALGDRFGQPGTAFGGSGADSFISSNSYTYQQIRTALLAIPNPNSIQQQAWSLANLPAITPSVLTGSFSVMPILAAILGLETFVPNATYGFTAFGTTPWNDVNQNGLGAGINWWGGGFHESTENLGRLDMSSLWAFISAGNRQVPDGSSSTFFSINNGVSNLAGFNNGGIGGDNNDIITAGDPYNYLVQTGSVSRSSVLPGTQFNWQEMTTIGWGLTTAGLTYAGIGSGQTSVGLVSLRR